MNESSCIWNFLDILKSPSAAVAALVGLAGVIIGAGLTASLAARRDRTHRRMAFIEKQISEFYSPMVGLRAEIRVLSELRVKLQNEADAAWRKRESLQTALNQARNLKL